MRSFSSSLKRLRFCPPDTLPSNDYAAVFRDSFFRPQKPVVFARGGFRDLPAISRWFLADRDNSTPTPSAARFNYDYLDKYGECHVPLELTQRNTTTTVTAATTSEAKDNHETVDRYSFTRSHAPLSLFLGWTRAAQQQDSAGTAENHTSASDSRLYLAQCQLLDLHADLRADLPTPSIISTAGKGDVYDTNIWMGLAPTYTPLHRDPNPNLFVQLAGTKRVRLLAPEIGQGIFARVREKLGRGGGSGHGNAAFRGEDMMEGLERKLLDQEVWCPEGAAGFDGYETSLEAGDGLFIPLGWWHSIKGEGDGITASVRSIHLLTAAFRRIVDLFQSRAYFKVNWWFR